MSAFPPPPQPPPLEVVAGVLERDGRILVARRPESKSNGGLWEFPGGKVEPHEDHALALARELREELGVEIEVGPHVITVEHAYPFGRIRLHAYACALRSGEPAALEHSEVRYVAPSDMAALPFAPANLPIVAALAGGSPWRA